MGSQRSATHAHDVNAAAYMEAFGDSLSQQLLSGGINGLCQQLELHISPKTSVGAVCRRHTSEMAVPLIAWSGIRARASSLVCSSLG